MGRLGAQAGIGDFQLYILLLDPVGVCAYLGDGLLTELQFLLEPDKLIMVLEPCAELVSKLVSNFVLRQAVHV